MSQFVAQDQCLRLAGAVGECQAYKFLQEMNFETLQGEMHDD